MKDTGGWTHLSNTLGTQSIVTFGIKNNYLYSIATSGDTITLFDNTGVWSAICGSSNSAAAYGFGIKNEKLYAININTYTQISNLTGWSAICGQDEAVATATKCGFGICNGALYSLKGSGITLLDDIETWIKVRGSNADGIALTQSGKLYKISSNQITQIGTNSNWIDFSGYTGTAVNSILQLSAVRNGNVYVFSSPNYEEIQITTNGNYTKVYDGFTGNATNPIGIFWTGSITEDIHNVYTVPAPTLDFNTYSNVNGQKVGKITATSSSPYTITDEYYTYTRNSTLDTTFTIITEDSSKQLMSMTDFLACFLE